MTAPLISVMVPTFNDAERLTYALQSLQSQTFTDYEVLVGDDCSTNNTAAIAEDFCRSDSRFRLFASPQNVGMTRHWNRLWKEAKGRFLCKLDGDDAYQPEMLERLFNLVEAHKAEIGFCRTIDCDANLLPVSSYYGERAMLRHQIEPLQDAVRNGHDWYRISFDGYQLWHSNAFMISLEKFRKLGGWDQRWGCSADTDFILRILEDGSEVCFSSYPGVLYRRRKGSVFDTFRQKSWHRLESAAVHLLSLQRMWRVKPEVCRSLCSHWRRYWSIWQSEIAAAAKGDREFEGLEAVNIMMEQPPWSIRSKFSPQSILSKIKTP